MFTAKLFTAILKLAYAPNALKTGVSITLIKKGNKRTDDPDNYRIVALSFIILKLYDYIFLLVFLFDYIQPLIHSPEGGFPKHFDCLMTLIMLRESIYFESVIRLYVCFSTGVKSCVWMMIYFINFINEV